MQGSVEQRLRSLELATEALSRRMDSLVGQRQIISHENSSHMLEQSNQQLSRARPRLQPIQNPPAQIIPVNTEASGPLTNQQIIHYYQPEQASSNTALNMQVYDSARQPYSSHTIYPQGTVHPQGSLAGGANAPFNALEIALDNKWQIWSCCLLWVGLMKLLTGIGFMIIGLILLVQYFKDVCQQPDKVNGKLCCSSSTSCRIIAGYQYSTPVIFICVGSVAGIIGIVLLVRSYRVYRNNKSTCC